MNSETKYIEVIKRSTWTRGCKSDLPTRVVMWRPDDLKARGSLQRENQYVTHYEVKYPNGVLAFTSGHYDMRRGVAEVDFANRCVVIGVHEEVGFLVR